MLVQSFSGIRGIYGKDLTDDISRKYAYIFNEFLKKKLKRERKIKDFPTSKSNDFEEPTIVVGYDTRPSNKALKQSVMDSLFNIIDVGIMPVAAIELAVREYKADGGIVITASHNEPEYNGFKFLDNDGAVLRSNDMVTVINEFNKIINLSEEEFLDKHLYKKELKNRIKRVVKVSNNIIDKYSEFFKKIIGKIDNKTKIILDINGGSAIILKEIIKKLDIKNIKLINDKPGEFKRRIEPDEESLNYLKNIIKKEKAEFAAGFDCDADRVEIMQKDGTLVDGNQLLALIVDDILTKHKGTVVTNDATSNVVRRIAEKHDCTVKEVEVGEINVVDEMLKLKSPIGGEGSNGGIIIPPSRCRDGILSIFYLLDMINKKKKSLKQMVNELPIYHTLQKKIKSLFQLDCSAMRQRSFRKSHGENSFPTSLPTRPPLMIR